MSKKIIYSKHIEKGRFYHRSDSRGGHPALIVRKNDKKNQYGAIIFTSSKKEPRTRKLKHSIDAAFPSKQYRVHIDPYIGKRRDYGRKELDRLHVHKSDKKIIKRIKKDSRFDIIK